jgi:hypothetical protein
MKNVVTLIAACLVTSLAFANNAELIVQRIDNGSAIAGDTYRVYVKVSEPGNSVHAIFGDDYSSMSINCTSSFYQHEYGGHTTLDVNQAILQMAPTLAYDSWVTIGAVSSLNNNLWEVGIDFESFDTGSSLTVEDGAWFLLPTDVQSLASSNNLVLIAQLTTEGVASGTINVQGWDANQEAWQERGLTFSTSNAHVFGCMNSDATNYSAEASYDDGSCEFDGGSGNNTTSPTQSNVKPAKEEQDWQIFPNPIWEGQFNIQFSDVIAGKSNVVINITDMNGKVVHSMEVADENVIGGNRLIIQKDLSAGMYTVSISQGDHTTSQQVVVQK